ncbi:hypothetical protein DMUE_5913 [Dictyocoela muelleri]|nr:hypothetical protein DMUE_5913 [Dictyocoela muelleri]
MEKSKKRNMDLHYKHYLFLNLIMCREELVISEIINDTRICSKCLSLAELKIYKENESSRLLYRCLKKCKKKESMLKGIKLPLEYYIFFLYLIFIRHSYNQIKLLTKFSNGTIASAKTKLSEKISVLKRFSLTLKSY